MRLLNFLMGLIYPNRCAFCGTIILEKETICLSCWERVYLVGDEVCPFCGRDYGRCHCTEEKEHWCDGCVAPFYYSGPIREAILRLKFGNCPESALVLAKLVADRVKWKWEHLTFDCISGIPMHPKREKKRGYNQSALLAEEMAFLLGICFDGDVLRKVKNGTPQHELGAKERRTSMVGTVALKEKASIQGKHILLIDDVFTTGSTLSECARVLKEGGAAAVYGAVVAVTE